MSEATEPDVIKAVSWDIPQYASNHPLNGQSLTILKADQSLVEIGS
jgi:hypothetical protein